MACRTRSIPEASAASELQPAVPRCLRRLGVPARWAGPYPRALGRDHDRGPGDRSGRRRRTRLRAALAQDARGDLCRDDPQHAADRAALSHLLRPAQRRREARRQYRGHDRAVDQSRRLLGRDRARRPGGDSALADRGRPVARPLGRADLPLRHHLPRAAADVPRPRQPVHPANAGDQRGLADLRAGSLPYRLHRSIPHLPRLRGLYRRRRGLSRPGTGLSPAVRGALSFRVCPQMIREFSFNDVLYLVAAMRWTLALTAIAFLGGGLVGLTVALFRVSAFAPLRWVGTIYVLAVQGTPLLAWLFVFFFGLSIVGVEVSPWIAAAAAYSIYAGAFLGEIWRGCLQAIPKTQWEAGASLGLSFTSQLRYIIVPQATRLAIPPTVGFLVQLIKNTSLAAVIGFIELTREGQLTTAVTFRPFTVYLTVAALYFALCFPLTQVSRRLERRLHVAR